MSVSFDPQKYRPDFPILSRQINNKPLVYLDNAATSQKPNQVIDAMANYYRYSNANVHRGVHTLGDESTKAFHESRRSIAEFFHAKPSELVIVRNTTEAVNLVAYSWGESEIKAGEILILSELDHHSNIVPWQELAKRKRAEVVYVPVDEVGRIDMNELKSLMNQAGKQLRLVAISHVSNTLGTQVPIEAIAELIHSHRKNWLSGTRFFVDGAQSAPHLPINFSQLGVDFYAVSAHKMLGPMGIGAVLVREEILKDIPPFLYGGGMIESVTLDGSTFQEDLEERFTAGTPDVASLVGWAAACKYLEKIGMQTLFDHDQVLVHATLQMLGHHPEIKILGPTTNRVGSVAFVYQGVHAHDVGQILDSEGVAVRTGHHCTMPLHLRMGVIASTRASFQLYSTLEEIQALESALGKVKTVFGV